MDTPDTTRTASPGRSTVVECCNEPGCASGLRNNYFEGKRLTPDLFRVEQRYHIERRHLLNRALYGNGVVYGYAISVEEGGTTPRGAARRRLRIGSGLALDACGRELVQVGAASLAIDRAIVLDGNGRRAEDATRAFADADYARKHGEVCWLLSAHYAEQDSGRVRVPDPCECDAREWDHTCETVRYSLRPIPCDECCADEPCGLTCRCGAGPCCDAERKQEEHGPYDQADPRRPPPTRGGCRCICDHLTGLELPDDCDVLRCEIEEPCGRVRVDLGQGVPLACLRVVRDACGDWTFDTVVEACGPRRFVKRNDVLYDLIRGCDLTRIADIGWRDWHRRQEDVPFDDFSRAMGAEGSQQHEYVTTDFWVRFSRPVRTNTLHADCVAITVLSVEREGSWRQSLRVPVARLDTELVPPEPGDPADHVRSARVVVDGSWVEDALRGRASLFRYETWVEIEIRGDFIVDCNGQTVDANAHGLSAAVTGNGTPGGTFLSTFRVAPREGAGRPPYDAADRGKGASS